VPREKLSPADRREIVRLRALGVTQDDLAAGFGVSSKTIRQVTNGPQARKAATRPPKSTVVTMVSVQQMVDSLDRACELLSGVDALLESGRPAAAKAAIGAVIAAVADAARDLEVIAGKPPTPLADAAFGFVAIGEAASQVVERAASKRGG
jgi:transposase-like protein